MQPDSPPLSPDSFLLTPDGVVYAMNGTLRSGLAASGVMTSTGSLLADEAGVVRSPLSLSGAAATRYAEAGTLRSRLSLRGAVRAIAASDLYNAAQALLAASEAALAATTGGVPARSFVSISEPSFDCCDQLSVHWRMINVDVFKPNQPADLWHRVGRNMLNQVTLAIVLLRCYPVMQSNPAGNVTLPTTAALNAAAAMISEDGWALWNAIVARHADGSLFGPFPCRDLQLGTLQPINPQGGCAGVLLPLTVHLDGYVA